MELTQEIPPSQPLDHVDLQFCLLALDRYRRDAVARWSLLDRLHAERACLMTDIARQLRKSGRLDNREWNRACREIDELLNRYDDESFYRHEMLRFLNDLIAHIRATARGDRDARKGARYAA